ncbi:hypothetical protein VF04_26135 [Nostoc linckia z7]|uniref:Uncharacterized protein n=1 Tax=Nostoc linckia z7 TaxID=1628745 RepID=A0ABX4KIP2_NOSLI|nr:hypothetical protein VF04_26135 [Nostoc linckia z7]
MIAKGLRAFFTATHGELGLSALREALPGRIEKPFLVGFFELYLQLHAEFVNFVAGFARFKNAQMRCKSRNQKKLLSPTDFLEHAAVVFLKRF